MRLISIKQAYSKKFQTFDLDDDWREIFGNPEKNGAWLVYGRDKHGKTTLTLMLAKMLSDFEKVTCCFAEEGISKNIIETAKRVGIDDTNKNIKLSGYETFEELDARLSKRESSRITIVDNITVYNDEVTKKQLLEFIRKHEKKLIIFLAHEERKEPQGALAKLWKKLSKIILHVEGLKAFVSGRCPGGTIIINEEKSQTYWGTETPEKT